MAKRKAQFNAAAKNNQTPYENKKETEFSAKFSGNENTAKHANRNSKQGKKGRS